MMARYTILSTKKIDPSLKQEMEQKGIDIIEQEFIDIQPILTKEKNDEVMSWVHTPDKWGVAFTSQHAVKSIEQHIIQAATDLWTLPAHWQIFCLGGATKEAMITQLWPSLIVDTAPNATELAAKIIANGQHKQIVFFCGSQRRDELPHLLKEAGIEVIEIVVYETVATPTVTTNNLDAVLFFSPSAVKSFFSVNTLKKETACFAIGNTTAAAIGDYTGNKVITSEQPNQLTMLKSVSFYLQNIDLYK